MFGRSGSLGLYSRHFAVRGLYNYGLSCCVNSLLQSFHATTELLDIMNKWTPEDVDKTKNLPLHLKESLQVMRDPSNVHPHLGLLDCLYCHITRNGCHDADEIFHIILNLIQKQMSDPNLIQEICNLFKIKVETRVTCLKCKEATQVPGSSFSLSVAIKERENTLENCIQSFFQKQELEEGEEFYCKKCEQKQPSTHKLDLVSLPLILCIHIKRFRNCNGLTRKLSVRVTFPETLEMLIEGNSEKEHYTLYAVIVHDGGVHCGHYTTYIRTSQDTWFFVDDSRVQPAQWEHVKNTYGGHGCMRNTVQKAEFKLI